ncbi:cytolethal distending toxin subunit A [Salmonella enterica]|nr:cytolethal distending toxin subunit A [Salmonella enterica]
MSWFGDYMKIKGIYLSVFIIFLTSCSSQDKQNESKGNIYPSADFPVPPALPLPSPGLKTPPEINSDGEVSYTSLRTIMAQNGRVLTVWALAEGNWLWVYGSATSSSFGGVRNWHIVPVNKRGENSFRFINGVTGTCIEAYKNGLIHSVCNNQNSAQDFLLIPATNGGVFIKSPVKNKCVRYDIITHTIYSTVYLTECISEKDKVYDQIWYMAPALISTTPLP